MAPKGKAKAKAKGTASAPATANGEVEVSKVGSGRGHAKGKVISQQGTGTPLNALRNALGQNPADLGIDEVDQIFDSYFLSTDVVKRERYVPRVYDTYDDVPYFRPDGWWQFRVPPWYLGLEYPEGVIDVDDIKQWPVAYHGTSCDKLAQILNSGLRKPGEFPWIEAAHGQARAGPSKAIYLTPSLWYASHPVYSQIKIVAPEVFVQIVVKLRVRPGTYRIEANTLGDKHWDLDLVLDPNYPTHCDLEWLLEGQPSNRYDAVIVGVMLREFGANAKNSLNIVCPEFGSQAPEYKWTERLQARLREGCFGVVQPFKVGTRVTVMKLLQFPRVNAAEGGFITAHPGDVGVVVRLPGRYSVEILADEVQDFSTGVIRVREAFVFKSKFGEVMPVDAVRLAPAGYKTALDCSITEDMIDFHCPRISPLSEASQIDVGGLMQAEYRVLLGLLGIDSDSRLACAQPTLFEMVQLTFTKGEPLREDGDSICRHNNLMTTLVEHGKSSAELTVEDVLFWHRLGLTGLVSNAGSFRSKNVRIGRNTGAPTHMVHAAMKRFAHDANIVVSRPDVSASAKAAWCAYNLVAIHPFSDGNGRISRALVTWALARHGLPKGLYFVPLFSHDNNAMSRKAYTDAVKAGYLPGGSHLPLARHIMECLVRTFEMVSLLDPTCFQSVCRIFPSGLSSMVDSEQTANEHMDSTSTEVDGNDTTIADGTTTTIADDTTIADAAANDTTIADDTTTTIDDTTTIEECKGPLATTATPPWQGFVLPVRKGEGVGMTNKGALPMTNKGVPLMNKGGWFPTFGLMTNKGGLVMNKGGWLPTCGPMTNMGAPRMPQAWAQAPQPAAPGQPLNVTFLAAAPPHVQKQMIGEKLFPAICKYWPERAMELTGVLLEMDNSELIMLLESEHRLKAKIDEAMQVLGCGGK